MEPGRLIAIDDPADDRVAVFRDIRERDLVGRRGLFIAEGSVVLRMLARSTRFEADSVLVLDSRVDGIADILDRFDERTPIMVCNRDVIDRIAGFPMHRGVLAAGRVKRSHSLRSLLDAAHGPSLALICAGIANHDNLGGLFRNAAAFAADFVCLDGQCCDPLYRKAIRVSVGAALTVPYARGGDLEDLTAMLGAAGFDILALSPAGEATIDAIRPETRTALLVGSEGDGLPRDLMRRFRTVRIPQSPSMDSLNVSTAAGIALHAVASAMRRLA